MIELALRNATIVDGTGAAPFQGDVCIASGRIAAIEPPGTARAERALDCSGLLLTPGFIDIHSHSDLTLLLDPRAVSAIHQGVTLEVIGNCGHGCAPLRDPQVARDAMYGPIPSLDFFKWSTFGGYLDQLAQARPAINVIALVPNGQLRLSRIGREQRPATPAELQSMCEDLESCFDAGAYGFSTGLEYVREIDTTTTEVDTLCRIVERRGGLYATHTRNRDKFAIEAIEEAIGTARRTGVCLQLSHITPRGGMAQTEQALICVERARHEGLDVGFDMHTRLFGYTHLKNLLPSWALNGTPADLLQRLTDPACISRFKDHPNLISAVGDWSRILLVDSVACARFNGLSFVEIGRERGCDPFTAAMAVLAAEAEYIERPMAILKTYSEDMLRTTYQAADCMIGSDAATLAPDGTLAASNFHGAYTWSSWFLRRMVRELRALTLAEGVHRLTALPARRLGLKDRGRIAVGCHADVAVMDWESYTDTGTVEAPSRLATGMHHVIVNGVATLENGAATDLRAGSVLRRSV